MIALRVAAATRAEWQARANADGLSPRGRVRMPVSDGSGGRLVTPRRKPLPAADPKLLAAIARTGNNGRERLGCCTGSSTFTGY